jgi:branched-chain amino acid transport system substrate-binding protein
VSSSEQKARPAGRRRLLPLMAMALFALVLSAALAACGSSDSGSSSSSGESTEAAETTEGGETTEESEGEGEEASAGGEVGKELTALLNPEAAGPLGTGETLNMGLSIPQDGQGAAFGDEMSKGTELAVEQIEEMEGPQIKLSVQNDGSGDPEAGVANMKAFNREGIGTALTANIANLGSQLGLAEQYKILLLDPGGGAGGINAPYFWGTRADVYFSVVPGLFKFINETEGENVGTISFVGDTLGPEIDKAQEKLLKEEAQKMGWKFGGFITNTLGETDYANAISELEATNPDVVIFGEYGRDAGFALRQMQAQGLDLPTYGYAFTDDIPETAGGAEEGFRFAADYFLASAATNDWAKLFASTYEEKYGKAPGFYAANYYESAFLIWELARRVLKEKGDINSGTAMQEALEAEPSFPSLLGGEGKTLGVTKLDPETHAVAEREMGVYEYTGGEIKPLAYFGYNASNFRLVE